MDIVGTLTQFSTGFAVVFEPTNLFACFIGVLIGTMIGVLPGIGPMGAMAILLPTTIQMTPIGSIILLSGIYYGAQYGGSTTSILVNIPGEAASVITTLDGHQMALQGRAGPALGISAFGSFIGGTAAILGLMFLAPPLVNFALKFGPPEYFSLMLLGLVVLAFLSSTSMVRALMMAVFGVILGMIGVDPISGLDRFTLNSRALLDGIGFVPLIMGLFGISEVLNNLEPRARGELAKTKIRGLLPTREDWARSKWPILRGLLIGFFLGIIPGGTATIASFTSYAIEKRISKHPEKFGKGAIEGVAAPETANNSAAQASFLPMLTMGIPANVVMAFLLGAMIIHGITPGPLLLRQHPEIFWGIIASMYIGNLMLLVLNLPLIPVWVQLLKVPHPILFPIIIVFCFIGSYSFNNSTEDVAIMLIFGIIGYLMKKVSLEAAPLVLAFVLGPMIEQSFRQSLIKSGGNFTIFFTHPISATFLLIAIALIIAPFLPWSRGNRLAVVSKAEDA